MKKQILPIALCAVLLASCGGDKIASSKAGNTSVNSQSDEGGFGYEDPNASNNGGLIPSYVPSSSAPRASDFDQLDIQTLVTIDKDGEFVVEAEDLDLSGATMQDGCRSFYEYTDTASAGMCIACVSNPTILAFAFDLNAKATVSFVDVCAKYEDPYDFDGNVVCYVDSKDPFVTGYTAFGHTESNLWYNWKEVPLGSLELEAGKHVFYIKVVNSLPNTDCFKLTASNYGA